MNRSKLRKASRTVLVSATSLVAGYAIAQDQNPANTPVNQSAEDVDQTIVVTGTSIKGVAAPIGSSLVSVGEIDPGAVYTVAEPATGDQQLAVVEQGRRIRIPG